MGITPCPPRACVALPSTGAVVWSVRIGGIAEASLLPEAERTPRSRGARAFSIRPSFHTCTALI